LHDVAPGYAQSIQENDTADLDVMRTASGPACLLSIQSKVWPDKKTVGEAENLVHGRHSCVKGGTEVAGILPKALGREAPASRNDDR
jgi:hypothetical protein